MIAAEAFIPHIAVFLNIFPFEQIRTTGKFLRPASQELMLVIAVNILSFHLGQKVFKVRVIPVQFLELVAVKKSTTRTFGINP